MERLPRLGGSNPVATVIVDEPKLKALLKSLIEDVHYQAVATHVIANKIKAETHNPIEDINAGFGRLHEMLDEAIYEGKDDAKE